MNIKDIMSIVTVALMAVGCSSDDGLQSREGRVPITLSASVGTEVTTRGVQETALASGETVYVWGKEGSGNYDYLQAWTLTAGADGALSGSAKYYPLSGETLTMVALHGNFTYTEGTSDLTATISHSVEADQSATNAYEKSDLLWASETGSSTDAANKSFDFTHKLSKIEVKLHPGEGYADISSAEVRLRGVLPTITIDPTDGSLGSASGTATLVKARKTEDKLSDATTPYAIYEAIIPPQTAPTAFLNIKIGDKVAAVEADVAAFASNKRYLYDITITEISVLVSSEITPWDTDDNLGTLTQFDPADRIKLNPLWYVAKNNVQYTPASGNDWDNGIGTFSMATSLDDGYLFTWSDALTHFGAQSSSYSSYMLPDPAITIDGANWHLPVQGEWLSIVPAVYDNNDASKRDNLFSFSGYRGTGVNPTVIFGYNDDTKGGIQEASWWKKVDGTEMHAIRFLGTDYCSAWKYKWDSGTLTISAMIISKLEDDNTGDSELAWYNSHWSSLTFGNSESTCAVERSFKMIGWADTTSPSATTGASDYFITWSATEDGNQTTRAWEFHLTKGTQVTNINGSKTYGVSVRLFRDN